MAEALNQTGPLQWSLRAVDPQYDDDAIAERAMDGRAILTCQNDKDAAIHIRASKYDRNHRLEIYPRRMHDRGQVYPIRDKDRTPAITCDGLRPARDIARDIPRRIIHQYALELTKARHERDDTNAREDGRKALAVRLGKLLGTEPHRTNEVSAYTAHGVSINAEAEDPREVTLKLRNVPEDKAREIIALLTRS